MTRPATRRPAFTLVELMVATALVVLILTILAVAFGTATESLSKMRQIGTLAERLRTTEQILRADLSAQHFEANGSSVPPQLSDLRYNLLTSGGKEVTPPLGYFRIEQGSGNNGSIYEGKDNADAISSRAANHAVEFTMRREGRTPDDFFVVDTTGAAPAGTPDGVTDVPVHPAERAYHWARVRWTLGNPQTVDGVTTYTLYRCVRVLVPENGLGSPISGNLIGLYSSRTQPGLSLLAQTLSEITDPQLRVNSPIKPYPRPDPSLVGADAFESAFYGNDIVLTNVLSFEVKPAWEPGLGIRAPRPTLMVGAAGAAVDEGGGGIAVTNSELPHDDLPPVPATENPNPRFDSAPPGPMNRPRVFDTWGAITAPGKSWNTPGTDYSIPLRIRVTAVQVKLRVYDPKNFQTRQVTFIVPQ